MSGYAFFPLSDVCHQYPTVEINDREPIVKSTDTTVENPIFSNAFFIFQRHNIDGFFFLPDKIGSIVGFGINL